MASDALRLRLLVVCGIVAAAAGCWEGWRIPVGRLSPAAGPIPPRSAPTSSGTSSFGPTAEQEEGAAPTSPRVLAVSPRWPARSPRGKALDPPSSVPAGGHEPLSPHARSLQRAAASDGAVVPSARSAFRRNPSSQSPPHSEVIPRPAPAPATPESGLPHSRSGEAAGAQADSGSAAGPGDEAGKAAASLSSSATSGSADSPEAAAGVPSAQSLRDGFGRIGPVLVPPRVITSAGTDYPLDAFHLTVRRQDLGRTLAVEGAEGTVGVRALVQAAGTVAQVEIAASSGSAVLDRAAVQAVQRWSFAPATRDGVPIDAYVVIRVRYVIR